MSAIHTPTLCGIIGARLLPLGYSFGVVVCFEVRLPSRRLLFDDVAIWVAEDLRTDRNAENPYCYCNEHIEVSMRRDLGTDLTVQQMRRNQRLCIAPYFQGEH